MEIDGTILTYTFVGLYALFGFYRGWWREAMTTTFLAVLVLLLQQPVWAQFVIDSINSLLTFALTTISRFVTFELTAFQLDATNAETWLVILLIMIGLSTMIAYRVLPSHSSMIRPYPVILYYTVNTAGHFMGIIVGAMNGFVIINLVREYMDGRSLPGTDPVATSQQLTLAGDSAVGPAATNFLIEVNNFPAFTILDSFVPWFAVIIGLFTALVMLRNKIWPEIQPGAGSRINTDIIPYGYDPFVCPPPPGR